jgi:hypothetical protein
MVRLMKRWTKRLALSLAVTAAVLLIAGCTTGPQAGARAAQRSTRTAAAPGRATPAPSGRDETLPAPATTVASAAVPSASEIAPADAQEQALPATTPPSPRRGATATPPAGALPSPLPGRPPIEPRSPLCPPLPRGERIPLGEARSRQEIVEKARRDLAARLDLPLAAIQVVSVAETRPGPPPGPPRMRPDRAYPDEPYPALPTYHVVLSAGGVQYRYQACGQWLIFLDGGSPGCDPGEA